MPDFTINVKQKGAEKAEKKVKGLNKALGGLKSSAMSAAGAFLGAGALVAGIKKATDAFAEQELAEKKLQQALGSSTTALLNQASALQKTSIFGDEATIAQQAFLASLKFSEEQIKTIIPVAMDLASATGMSLESAVRNTAKTFSGLAGELGEMVPQLRELTAEQMKAGMAVEVMGQLFGGAAVTEAQTMTGQLAQMKNAAGDTAEAVGGLLAPAIGKIATAFKSASENATEFINKLADETKETKENTLTKERNEAVTNLFGNAIGFISNKMADFGFTGGLRTQLLAELEQQEKEYSESLRGQAHNVEEIEKAELRRTETSTNYLGHIKKVGKTNATLYDEESKLKQELLKQDLKAAALSGQSASDSMKSVVRAKYLEAVAEQISNIMGIVPFPFNIGIAAGAGTLMSGIFDKAMSNIPSFATGGDFVTNGEQLIRVGDNPSGRERVQVTPLDAGGTPTGGGAANIVLNISGNVMSDDFVEDTIAPKLKEAIRRGADIGVS